MNYPSAPFAKSHPDNLHAIGRLFGVKPADLETARILEIGCASGGNIIPIAAALPNATVVGFDYSESQIKEGHETISNLSLPNLKLLHFDIMNVDADFGEFDYIIAHGIYSWVPPECQDKILEICRVNLSPKGLAYVSYNTYPGWHFRGIIRDMMTFHSRGFGTPQKQVEQARAILSFFADSLKGTDTAYAKMLSSELESLQNQSDNYLFHDHLEIHNSPEYFSEFVDKLKNKQLRYIGDACPSTMWTGNLTKETNETIQKVTKDLVKQEQYTDFLRNRMFRQSIISHANVTPDYNLNANRCKGAYFAANYEISEAGDPSTADKMTFMHRTLKSPVSSTDREFKTALHILTKAWPASIEFEQLIKLVVQELHPKEEHNGEQLGRIRGRIGSHLIGLLLGGMIDFKFCDSRHTTEIADRPRVNPLMVYQAKQSRKMTNLRHEQLKIDSFLQFLCQQFDGSRSRSDVVRNALKLADEGRLEIKVNNPKDSGRTDAQVTKATFKAAVDQGLSAMAQQALLWKE